MPRKRYGLGLFFVGSWRCSEPKTIVKPFYRIWPGSKGLGDYLSWAKFPVEYFNKKYVN